MSDTMNVAVAITARDAASPTINTVTKAAEQSASKTAAAAAAGASKSAAAVEASASRSRAAYEKLSSARETLGVRSERAIQREIQQTEAAYNRLARSGAAGARELARAQDASLKKVRELRNEMAGLEKTTRSGATILPGAVAMVAGAYQLTKPAVTRAVAYDHSVAGITNTLYSDRDVAGRIAGKAEVKAAISAALLKGGGDRDQAAATLNELLSSGAFSKDSAFKMLGTIQEASTGSNANSKDLAAIALSLKRAGVSEDRLPVMLSKTIRAGQLGGFELDDMARHLPAVMASALAQGITGEAGFERLLVSLQSSVLTAGAKPEAANNLINILEKLNSEDTAKDFKKQGIDLRGELAKGAARGEDTLTTFTGLIDRVIAKDPKSKAAAQELERLSGMAGDKKNPQREEALKAMLKIFETSVIGKFLQDRQALQGFRAEQQGKTGEDPLARRVREGIKADDGQELERSFAVMNDTLSVQTQRLANANAEGQDKALTGAGGPFKDLYQGAVSVAEQFPLLTASATAATGALGLLAASAGINAALGAGGKGGPVNKAVSALSGLFGGRTPAAPGAMGTASTLAFAAAPLLAMAGVTKWAGDTSNDKGRADTLLGVSGLLAGLLAAIGLDKEKEFERRRAEMRAELEVTVRDDGARVSRTKLESTNMTATMNTGNIHTGAP